MKEAKQPSHVKGYKERCINYSMCPLCYGCRSYSSSDLNCKQCEEDRKNNICDTKLHRADLIEKMISKTVIIVNDISK